MDEGYPEMPDRLDKGRTRGQLKAARDRMAAKLDHAENEDVRKRSGGRCEVLISGSHLPVAQQCERAATEIHHMLGGWRLRGRGKSALKEYKQHVCTECHQGITGTVGGKTLERIGRAEPWWTDSYRRVA